MSIIAWIISVPVGIVALVWLGLWAAFFIAEKLPDGTEDSPYGAVDLKEIDAELERSFAHKEVLHIINHPCWKDGQSREWFRPFLEANWQKAFGRTYEADGRPYG